MEGALRASQIWTEHSSPARPRRRPGHPEECPSARTNHDAAKLHALYQYNSFLPEVASPLSHRLGCDSVAAGQQEGVGVLAWDGAGHLGFGLALTPEQRGPKRRGRKKNKCPSSRGWRSRHKPHLHPPDEATGVWQTGTTSGAVARRFSVRPARVSDLRGCLRLAGVPGFGSDEETPIACLQHHTTRQVFPTSSPLRQTSNVQRGHRGHPCATVKLG